MILSRSCGRCSVAYRHGPRRQPRRGDPEKVAAVTSRDAGASAKAAMPRDHLPAAAPDGATARAEARGVQAPGAARLGEGAKLREVGRRLVYPMALRR